MDVIADYSERYGTPHPKTSWHQIIALVKRSGRYEMRERLIHADAMLLGRPEALSDPVSVLQRAKYADIAWPEPK